MTADRVIELARSQVGVTEYPPNSNNVLYNTYYYGHPVQDGVPKGRQYPWCVTFIQWLFKSEPTMLMRTASCSTLLNWCRKNGMIVDKPQIGDLCFMKFDDDPRYPAGHIGIVDKAKGAKDVYNIEGNTSEKGSQDNGGAVLRKHRTGKCIVAYARPKYQQGTITNITNRKSNEEVAMEIYRGKGGWGNNPQRKEKLAAAGYNPKEVQKIVDQLMRGQR